jgi:hypothetical protein
MLGRLVPSAVNFDMYWSFGRSGVQVILLWATGSIYLIARCRRSMTLWMVNTAQRLADATARASIWTPIIAPALTRGLGPRAVEAKAPPAIPVNG